MSLRILSAPGNGYPSKWPSVPLGKDWRDHCHFVLAWHYRALCHGDLIPLFVEGPRSKHWLRCFQSKARNHAFVLGAASWASFLLVVIPMLAAHVFVLRVYIPLTVFIVLCSQPRPPPPPPLCPCSPNNCTTWILKSVTPAGPFMWGYYQPHWHKGVKLCHRISDGQSLAYGGQPLLRFSTALMIQK